MSKKDRVAYTDAVLCLQSKPSKASPSLVPGSRSRFDDFQAIHINQTMRIHFNVCLNSHREVYEVANDRSGTILSMAPVFLVGIRKCTS